MVVILAVSDLFSGPIARYSSRLGSIVGEATVAGALANPGHDSIAGDNVQWDQSISSLDRANFPYDQLLDFLPDPSQMWVYDQTQWNSSWSASCAPVPLTPIRVEAVVIPDAPFKIWQQLPALHKVLHFDALFNAMAEASYTGIYEVNDVWKDFMVFILKHLVQ